MKDKKYSTINTIHFDITEFCNYHCEYCYQGLNKVHNHISENVYNNFFNFLSSIKEQFNVHLIGGEPFLYPKFFNMVEKIIDMGHKISCTTNFSHSKNILEKFLSITKGNISFIEISIHLTQIKNLSKFIDKLLWFKSISSLKFEDFQLNSIMLENNFIKIKELKEKIESYGFKLNIQRIFDINGYCTYSEEIEKWLETNNCIDIPLYMVIGKNFANVCGVACRSGNKFFKILIDGRVTRCFNDQEYGYNLLGNMNESSKVKILKDYSPCLSVNNKCRCYAGFIKLGQIDLQNKNISQYKKIKKNSDLHIKLLKNKISFLNFLKKIIKSKKLKEKIENKILKIQYIIDNILIYKY